MDSENNSHPRMIAILKLADGDHHYDPRAGLDPRVGLRVSDSIRAAFGNQSGAEICLDPSIGDTRLATAASQVIAHISQQCAAAVIAGETEAVQDLLNKPVIEALRDIINDNANQAEPGPAVNVLRAAATKAGIV